MRVNLVKSEEKVGDEAYSADPGGASYFLHSCKSCADIQPKNKVERKAKKVEFSFPHRRSEMGREYLRKLESQGRADELRFSSFSLKRKLFFIIT